MVRIFLSRRRDIIILSGLVALLISTFPNYVSATRIGRGVRAQDTQLYPREEYELSCDARLAGESMYKSREDMELELEQRAAPTDQPTAMPSVSPSLSIACSDPFSNARGSYTSSKAPCVISFHNEEEGDQTVNHLGANRKRYHQPDSDEETSSSYYHGTSTVCGSENKIGEAKEYVSGWPDECVGDFARCYDLRDPNYRMCQGLKKILAEVNDDLNRVQEDKWALPWGTSASGFHEGLLPPGTTHVSVDCTTDKEVLLENYQQALDLHHEMIQENISATKKQTLFVVASFLTAALIVVYAIAQLVVQPIVGAISGASATHRQRDDEMNSGGGGSQLVSLVSNQNSSSRSLARNSGLRLDTYDDQQEGEHYHVVQDEPEDMSTSENTIQQMQQIPLDFDAVPIVPATIIPFDAIPAEVMDDGITYYP